MACLAKRRTHASAACRRRRMAKHSQCRGGERSEPGSIPLAPTNWTRADPGGPFRILARVESNRQPCAGRDSGARMRAERSPQASPVRNGCRALEGIPLAPTNWTRADPGGPFHFLARVESDHRSAMGVLGQAKDACVRSVPPKADGSSSLSLFRSPSPHLPELHAHRLRLQAGRHRCDRRTFAPWRCRDG